MSTRAQVKIVDRHGDELWFYRHSCGAPKDTLPGLDTFLGWVKEGKIRDTTEQAAGWLILIGARENDTVYDCNTQKENLKASLTEPGSDGLYGWKCGAYEPRPHRERHADIEYFYTIDLLKKIITVETI